MLKVALIFYFCLWVILLIAGVMLWSPRRQFRHGRQCRDFVTELFALESFTFNADQIFRASAIGGLVLVVAGAGFTVLMAVLFNLISDVTGGVRFTVVEEETARPRPKRLRPRRGMLDRVVGAGQPQPGVVPAPRWPANPASRLLESAPDEGPRSGRRSGVRRNRRALPTPADAESGADPEIDGPDDGVVNGDDDR